MLGGSIRMGLVGEADMGAALRIDGIEPGGRIAEINILIARRAAAQRQRRLALASVGHPALRAYCYASDGRVLARYERSTGTPYAGMGELVGMDEDWPEAWLIEVWKQQNCIGRLQRLPSGEFVEIEAGWPRRLISRPDRGDRGAKSGEHAWLRVPKFGLKSAETKGVSTAPCVCG